MKMYHIKKLKQMDFVKNVKNNNHSFVYNVRKVYSKKYIFNKQISVDQLAQLAASSSVSTSISQKFNNYL